MLAGQAATIAAGAPRTSTERRGALCASVVLSTTSTPAAARRALVDADLPDPVRAAAAEVLAGLTASLVTGAVTSRTPSRVTQVQVQVQVRYRKSTPGE